MNYHERHQRITIGSQIVVTGFSVGEPILHTIDRKTTDFDTEADVYNA